MNLKYKLFICFCLLINFVQAETASFLDLSNEFIRIIVNNQDDNIGRFAIETTQGSPLNKQDDFQSLIYGRPLPWTSFTSIFSDNNIFIFGSKNPKLSKRSTVELNFTSNNQQYVSENKIITHGFCDGLKITQTLNFIRHPYTKVFDTALISYEIQNQSNQSKKVGLRILLDTMLGKNDAAPFRFGQEAITSERQFMKDDFHPYWQAFDSLSNPNVIAQGTLHYQDNNIMPPDKLLISNWGHLASNPWKNKYKKSRSFIQTGAQEPDTALALYWNPKNIAPGETQTFKTLYGLGGLNLSPGELSIGISCPSLLNIQSSYPFMVMIYVMNSGGYASSDTVLNIQLPEGFSFKQGKKNYKLGLLKPGETKQIPVYLMLDSSVKVGSRSLLIDVTSSTLESNQATHTIDILSPPPLKASASLDEAVIHNQDLSYSNLNLKIVNNSPFYYKNVSTFIDSKSNVRIPNFELISKNISIGPYESKTANWTVELQPVTNNIANIFTVIQTPFNSQEIFTSKNIENIFDLHEINLSSTQTFPEKYFYLEIILPMYLYLNNPQMVIEFDNELTSYVRSSIPLSLNHTNGNFFLKPTASRIVVDLKDLAFSKETLVFKFHFKALKKGLASFRVLQNNKQIDSLVIKIDDML